MDSSTEKSLFVAGSIIGGRYEVLDSLGSGGMGTVVRVVDRALNNEVVALKLLYPHMARDQVQFARFRNEVLIARKLAHPNIVRLYDFGAAGQGYYYISMEYVEGGSLSARIYGDRDKRPAFQECLELLYEICQGLACAHSYGVMHRDLKPDNILLTTDGTVKISDFGLARSTTVDRGLTATGDTVGTPYYMAPEQLRGDKLDPRVDLYALGIVAFELVVGRRPFFHESYITLAHMHFRDPIPQFAGKESGIPQWFQEFVERCAAKKPEDRFRTAEEAGAALLSHMSDAGNLDIERRPAVMSFDDARSLSQRKTTGRRLGGLLLAITVILAIAVGALVLVRNNPALRQKVAHVLLRTETSTGVDASSLKEAINSNIGSSDFLTAVLKNDSTLVATLLAGGVDVHLADTNAQTALHHAAKNANATIVASLLKAGARPNTPDRDGRMPLSLAAEVGAVEVIHQLLNAGADPSALDARKQTALTYAAKAGNAEIVQLLLQRGALGGIRDTDGKTALMFAVENRKTDVVRVLLDNKIELQSADNAGNTALHYATNARDAAIVRLLLASGASPVAANRQGKLPADLTNSTAIKSLFASAKPVVSVPVQTSPQSSRPIETTVSPKGDATLRMVQGGVEFRQRVWNRGDVIAEDIVAFILFPDNTAIQLEGPKSLDRARDAEYSAVIPMTVAQVRKGEFQVRCQNCRKR